MRPDEAQLYETALLEVTERRMVAALAAKALVNADGDEKRAVAQYIKLRVNDLQQRRDEALAEAARAGRREASRAEKVESRLDGAKRRFVQGGNPGDDDLATLLGGLSEDNGIVALTDRVRGNTMLHVCASRGMVEAVRLLLRCGADKDARNGNGVAARALAGSEEVVRLLS